MPSSVPGIPHGLSSGQFISLFLFLFAYFPSICIGRATHYLFDICMMRRSINGGGGVKG